MNVTLFELCSRQFVEGKTLRNYEEHLPKTCNEALERFSRQFDQFKDRYEGIFSETFSIEDVAMGSRGYVDVEETLTRLEKKSSVEEMFDLKLALGYEITDKLWTSCKTYVEGIVYDNETNNDLVKFRVFEYHKIQEKSDWNEELKFSELRQAFRRAFISKWDIAGYKLYEETVNPQERAALLMLAWFLCFNNQMTGTVLVRMFHSVGDGVLQHVTEDKFDAVFWEYANEWRSRPPTSAIFQEGRSRIPDEVNQYLGSWFSEWADEKCILLMMQDDVANQEEYQEEDEDSGNEDGEEEYPDTDQENNDEDIDEASDDEDEDVDEALNDESEHDELQLD